MEPWQVVVVSLYGLFSFLAFVVGFYQSYRRKNPYGEFYPIILFGALVWGDAVIFGLFWTIFSAVTLLFQDWLLFLLAFSIFITIRGLGETIFLLNLQFTPMKRYPPKHWPKVFRVFGDEDVYFLCQILWQCTMVVSVIASLYLGKLWLAKF